MCWCISYTTMQNLQILKAVFSIFLKNTVVILDKKEEIPRKDFICPSLQSGCCVSLSTLYNIFYQVEGGCVAQSGRKGASLLPSPPIQKQSLLSLALFCLHLHLSPTTEISLSCIITKTVNSKNTVKYRQKVSSQIMYHDQGVRGLVLVL